jgi:hypothetical protein
LPYGARNMNKSARYYCAAVTDFGFEWATGKNPFHIYLSSKTSNAQKADINARLLINTRSLL